MSYKTSLDIDSTRQLIPTPELSPKDLRRTSFDFESTHQLIPTPELSPKIRRFPPPAPVKRTSIVMGYLPILFSNVLLSALSISNLGIISSMVGFLLDQKHHVKTYQVNWPNQTVQLAVLPEHLWTDQGHESNGVAGYGFFLGLFGVYVALRQRRRLGKPPSKTLLALVVLQVLATLFTLSALIFVFLVTNQTSGQRILSSIATSDVPYPADEWTPETWFKAVLELPLANAGQRNLIARKVTSMMAWRWILVPLFLIDVLCLGVEVLEYSRQRKERGEGLHAEYVEEAKVEGRE